MTSSIVTVLAIVTMFLLTIFILLKPYLGLVFIVASQPVANVLPQVPMVSSVVPIFGAITIVAFLIKAKNEHIKLAFRFTSVHLLSLLLLFWFFLSNPTAAWSGADRNWVFTYLQLLVLLWLAGFLLDTPQKHHVLMWVFSIVTLVSAFMAILQGGFFEEIDPTIRASGLAQGANTAVRYFLISFVFLSYIRIIKQNKIFGLIATTGMIVAFLGIFYTVSRTGILLLMIALVLLVLLQTKFKYRIQISIITAIGIILLIFFSNSVIDFVRGIVPAISQGTDTVGLRYALWKAGLQMWQDHPISGVGIGMFPSLLKNYPNLKYQYFFTRGLVAHNMYISMLAETGLVGFILFMSIIFKSLMNFWKAGKIADLRFLRIRNVWIIIFVLMLLGGITKTDQVDKLIWLTMGVGVFFNNQMWIQYSRSKKAKENSIATNVNLKPMQFLQSIDQ